MLKVLGLWQLYKLRASAAFTFGILFLTAVGWYVYYVFISPRPDVQDRNDLLGIAIGGATWLYVLYLRLNGVLSAPGHKS